MKPLHTRLLALLLLPLMVTGGIPAGAQDAAPPPSPIPASDITGSDLQGRTIESIEFRGLQSLTEETLLYYLGLEPGQTLDPAELNRHVKDLWDRSLVDDIEVDAQPTGTGSTAGVKLTITVQERPVLRSIEYQGLKRISKTDIQDKLSSQRIRVREGEPLSLGELHRVKALIEEMYSEKGYRFAQARFTVEDVAANEKKVTFTVDEGNRVRIADIQFEGNQVYSDIRLQLAMKKVKESGLITRMMKKDIYDPAKLQEDLDKVRDVYRAAGYKNAVVGEPQIEVRALKPNAVQAKDQKRRMFITVPIEEGERWKLGEVTLEGNKVYSDQNLLRVFKGRQESWLRAKLIDEGVKSINDLYHNTGYIYAQVEPELIEKPDRVADVVVHIREGEQFKVGRIEFQGNERTQDKVLRRELRLYEGGVVNVGAVRNSVLKIKQLGYFELDQEDPVQIEPDVETKTVDLLFKGKEADRTELQFGGGWSELDGFFGQFAVNTKNFLGRGEQVGVSFQSGRYRDFFDLSYYVPWWLDRPQSIGLRIFDQNVNYTLYSDTQRLLRNSQGAVLTYGRNYRLFQSVSMSYNRSKYEDEQQITIPALLPGETPPPATDPQPGDVVTNKYSIDNSSLRPLYVFDSRDNPFEPTRGQRLSLGVEYAGGFLGGDNYFIRPELSYSAFVPVSSYPTRTVAAFNIEAGLVNAYDEKKYPLSSLERFYLGGENSIRGHRFRSIFLRKANGDPVLDDAGVIKGGDKYLQFNLEYHFLLGGPFRMILFGDGGNVYDEGQSIDLSRLRYTAGAELRVLLPVFGAPLRFIYAVNLDEQPKDSFEDFQFSIGTSF
jgi:outer membrane protein insertion porin family